MSHSTNIPLQRRHDHAAWTALSTADASNGDDESAVSSVLLPKDDAAAEHTEVDNNYPTLSWSDSSRTWLPYTLRRAFLSIMAAVSLSFSIALIALCVHSARNHGLGRDDRSSGLLIAWRYTPTIFAVFFTQAMVMIFDDIKRTESFARLARPGQADTSFALQYVPKAWWKSIVKACSKKQNGGHVGWLLLFSSIATGLSVLAVSTLSSSLLVPEQVLIRSDTNLKRYSSAHNGSINLVPRRETYFHTTSGYIYNVSTSMWVSDSHVIMPFGPENSVDHSDLLPDGLWVAETKIFQMESTCVPMVFAETMIANHTLILEADNQTFTYNSAIPADDKNVGNMTLVQDWEGMVLRSEDGCEIQLYETLASHPIVDEGGLFWSNLSATYISWNRFIQERGSPPFIGKTDWSPLNNDAIMEFSLECLDRNLLLVTTPWKERHGFEYEYWENFQYQAELCTPVYYEVTITANASISAGDRRITFDEDEFKKNRKQLGKNILDTAKFELYTFEGNKPEYLSKASIFRNAIEYVGLTENLQTYFSFNYTAMLHDSTLAEQATRLRARFFGELLFSSVTEQNSPVFESVIGQRIVLERRIVVVTEVAVSLAVLFFCLACYLCYTIWRVSIQQRPLNLSVDPATTLGVAIFYNDVNLAAGTEHGIPQSESRDERMTARSMSDLAINKFPSVNNSEVSGTDAKVLPQDWRPLALRTKGLTALLFAVVAIAAALIVLRNYADKQKLYRSAFVYEVDIGVFHANISPASLVATLIAVGLALWWDMIDKHMRSLQPYLSMAHGPEDVKRGACLSYESSHWVWAAGKAASNKHWLLVLVTMGTTLSQILIIAMAAVFEKQAGIYTRPMTIDRALATRQDHLTYQHTNVSTDANLLQHIMRTETADWLYSALDQLTLQAQSPAWSLDGWSFTPIVIESVPDTSLRQGSRNQDYDEESSELFFSAANVSLTTSAIRARLECNRITPTDSSWYNMNETAILEAELSKSVRNMTGHLNVTGYVLPRTIFDKDTYQTTIFTTPSRVFCCANGTDDGANSAVGYWSHTDPDQWWADRSEWTGFGPKSWPGNFTIKWIVGPATTSNLTIYTNSEASYYKLMQFTEIPALEILTCKPVIEQTDARVTIARSSSQVLDFELLGDPQRQHEIWNMDFDAISLNGSQEGMFGKNYTVEMSYAVYFMTQLLYAASSPTSSSNLFNFEDLEDERFNIRDKDNGLNMDFMSYSNYVQANKDPTALLNAETLLKYSQHTFQTFFQHFASQTSWIDGQPMVHQKISGQKVDVITTERIEVLAMVEGATWLCLAILFLLVVILGVLVVSLKQVYPRKTMLCDLECLADVLAMIENSHELLRLVEKYTMKELKERGMKTRLGWFRDTKGVLRWGIEVVDVNGVEWVEKREDLSVKDGVHTRIRCKQ
ncbi:hypothetical protein P153DRAFT_366257 [Dothidotthia symphoricarpi CBS 119687]|uniref:Uncharacterized protein n=1 Tax=Dothidotthia symphoricarpi CBS 119687 TaxID=1392245 RepID=A0A6A6AFN8_9PLEO|nr:uncharacterized protein P153DRAFT_366257 [Dothidotthia symphoricarpi CBS 119687]KAF2129747.1 hypothetical protein P153DRAFT_366257 [Dothidotthia symphoricarpi CBS 119687]